MTDRQTVIASILSLIALFTYAAFMQSLDNAMAEQLRLDHLSVYCQQEGAIETLCAELGGQ